MLELLIMPDGFSSVEDDVVMGLNVSNQGGRALCGYSGWLWPCAPRVDDVILTKYPRWAEPAGALCVRLLAKALKRAPAMRCEFSLLRFSVLVRLVPFGRGEGRILEQFDIVKDSTGWLIRQAEKSWHIPNAKNIGAAAVALRALTRVYWDGPRILPVKPISLPIYLHQKTSYIRMTELPEPARSAFEKNMAHSGRPYIPGIPDAAFSWDWTDFLEGGR